MKSIILVIVSILLISLNSKGQKEEYPSAYKKFISPDTLKLNLDTSFAAILKSLKSKTNNLPDHFTDSNITGKRKRPANYNGKKLNQDILVLDPGRSGDRMPNANVITPGVHYHLKIIPFKNKDEGPKERRPPPPGLRPPPPVLK